MNRTYNKNGKYLLVVCPNPAVDIYAWIPQFTSKESNRLTQEEHYPGGKGVHVAMAAAELGEKVFLLGFWGGPTGSWIKQECEKFPGLKCIGPEVEGWSRSCYTFKSYEDFDDTELLGVGPVVTPEKYQEFLSTYKEYLNDAMAVALSGSWPKGASEEAYAEMIDIATEKNKAVFLDCTGRQLKNAMKKRPYLVHMNRSEAIGYVEESDLQQASVTITSQCEFAAITDGAKGLYFCNGEKMIHASCTIDKDKIHSAVGSGDCLTAGLLVGFARNYSDHDSARLGVACGAANCLRKDLGMLFRKDAEELYQRAEAKETIIDYL